MDNDLERVIMAKLDSIGSDLQDIKINQAVMANEMSAIKKRQDAHEEEKKQGKQLWTGANITLLLMVIGLVLETIFTRVGLI